MHPYSELTRLAAHKAALRRDIALRRAQCVEAAAQVVQPLEWLDRVLVLWRRLSALAPLATVPLGILVARAVCRRWKFLRLLLRWGPLAFSVVGSIRSTIKNR